MNHRRLLAQVRCVEIFRSINFLEHKSDEFWEFKFSYAYSFLTDPQTVHFLINRDTWSGLWFSAFRIINKNFTY